MWRVSLVGVRLRCWSTTLRRVALCEMDSDELVEEHDYKGDFIDREGAVKIFSVVSRILTRIALGAGKTSTLSLSVV